MNGPVVVKMSGAGNDFLLLDAAAAARLPPDRLDWIRRVCRRGLSVGADGVIFVERRGEGRVGMRFHNPDGSEAFCGNGSRCAARFARERGLAGERMILETWSGAVPAEILGSRVRLTLPLPRDLGEFQAELGEKTLSGRWIDAGSPHFVARVGDVRASPLERWGPVLRRHPHFGAAGVNVDLCGPLLEGAFDLRTWERGVEGETLACGSGAVAAAFVARGETERAAFTVVPASGVPIEVAFLAKSTQMTGDARWIFEGALPDEATSGFP